MNVLLKLKCLLPGRRRAFEQDMREELESLASLSRRRMASVQTWVV
jgi:hypothetical protein